MSSLTNLKILFDCTTGDERNDLKKLDDLRPSKFTLYLHKLICCSKLAYCTLLFAL